VGAGQLTHARAFRKASSFFSDLLDGWDTATEQSFQSVHFVCRFFHVIAGSRNVSVVKVRFLRAEIGIHAHVSGSDILTQTLSGGLSLTFQTLHVNSDSSRPGFKPDPLVAQPLYFGSCGR
jgi:hypothetical protein